MPLPAPHPVGRAMLPPDTYAGQVVVVTGGGTGLGKAMATEFARLGAAVAIASRKAEHRESGVAALTALGAKAIGVELDVRDEGAVAATFDEIERELGPADVLINNAAGNFPSQAVKMSANAWRSVVDIVLNGTFLCSTEFARRAIARSAPGAILNIGATYSWTGGPGTAHSAAAKAGVTNMNGRPGVSVSTAWRPACFRTRICLPCCWPARIPRPMASAYPAAVSVSRMN
jgi:NAD(P)-dependent dehydrogenase (short-subunit alcohol dehydrogenase family)